MTTTSVSLRAVFSIILCRETTHAGPTPRLAAFTASRSSDAATAAADDDNDADDSWIVTMAMKLLMATYRTRIDA